MQTNSIDFEVKGQGHSDLQQYGNGEGHSCIQIYILLIILGQYLQNQCNPADSSCVRCPERLPNCEGLPDGENPVPGHHWSHDYVRCYKNRTLSVESCRNGYFNPWSRKCVNSIKKGRYRQIKYDYNNFSIILLLTQNVKFRTISN